MSRQPHHRCEFTYDYRPVGQGLFCRGELVFYQQSRESKRFHWVYDCGSRNSAPLRGEIDLFRRQLPEPKRLDLLVLSHFDGDHVKGVGRLLNGLPVDHLVLPYLNPAQRMMLVAGTGPDDLEFVRFLVSPAEYLINLPGAEIGTITFILPTDEIPPPEAGGLAGPEPGDGRPPEIQIDSEEPEKRMFADDLGMLLHNLPANQQGKTQLLVAKGQPRMDILGLWEFLFYNKPEPEKQAKLQGQVVPVFKEFYFQPETARNYDEFVRNLRGIYRQVFGTGDAERNDISLVTYTGPIMHRLNSAFYSCSNHCQYPASRDGRKAHGGKAQDANDGKISALYTGDLNFRQDITKLVSKFLTNERWQRIRFMQVPHHGSRHSWELGQAGLWHNEWSVFSAGLNNSYQHPHQEVLDELHSRNPVSVNEMQGAAWGGLVRWKKR